MVRAFVYLATILGFASAWQHSRAGCQRGRVVLKAEEKPWVPPTPADWQEDKAALGSTPSWLASAAAPPAKAAEAVAAPTAEAWRQTCDSDGVVSWYGFGLRLSAAAPAEAPPRIATTVATPEASAAIAQSEAPEAAMAPAGAADGPISTVAGVAVLAAGATALGLDAELAAILAAGAAAASLSNEESNFAQLTRSVGKLARATAQPVVDGVSDELARREREKPARDLFPSNDAGRVFQKPAPARKPAPEPTPAPAPAFSLFGGGKPAATPAPKPAAPFSFGAKPKPAAKPTPAPASKPAFGLFGSKPAATPAPAPKKAPFSLFGAPKTPAAPPPPPPKNNWLSFGKAAKAPPAEKRPPPAAGAGKTNFVPPALRSAAAASRKKSEEQQRAAEASRKRRNPFIRK